METCVTDHRLSRRRKLKTPLRLRIWKSGPAEENAESVDLSEGGIFFATDILLDIGSAVEILLKMPEEIRGKPAARWRCTGRVVRIEPAESLRGNLGVGVQFDYYQILQPNAPLLT